jgi:hypothetical protein
VHEYRWQDHSNLEAYVDSEFAGDFASRKSTSGGCIMRGTHLIKYWSTSQSVIALSTGKAELYGVVTGASHVIGLKSIAADFSVEDEKLMQAPRGGSASARASARSASSPSQGSGSKTRSGVADYPFARSPVS